MNICKNLTKDGDTRDDGFGKNGFTALCNEHIGKVGNADAYKR